MGFWWYIYTYVHTHGYIYIYIYYTKLWDLSCFSDLSVLNEVLIGLMGYYLEIHFHWSGCVAHPEPAYSENSGVAFLFDPNRDWSYFSGQDQFKKISQMEVS